MKPNILFVSTPKTWRGGESQIFELIKAIQKKANVFVFCPLVSPLYFRCKENNIVAIGYKTRFATPFFAARQLKKTCVAHAIDVVHNNDSGAQTLAYISSILFKNTVPCVLSKRTIFPFSVGKLSTAKYTHKNLSKIICVSKAAKKVVLENYRFPKKVVVINNGIDLNRYTLPEGDFLKKELGLSDRYRIIGFIGGLSEEKGISHLIDAFVQINKRTKDVLLVIIGEGSLKKTLIQKVQDYNLNDHVIFTGFRNDIPKVFKELDVFVLPSLAEGFPNVILEAFVSKVPVVATNVGGVPEIIKDGKNGFMVMPKKSGELAKNILKILDNKNIADSIVENAYREVTGKHSIEITAQKMLSVYKEVIGPGSWIGLKKSF